MDSEKFNKDTIYNRKISNLSYTLWRVMSYLSKVQLPRELKKLLEKKISTAHDGLVTFSRESRLSWKTEKPDEKFKHDLLKIAKRLVSIFNTISTSLSENLSKKK